MFRNGKTIPELLELLQVSDNDQIIIRDVSEQGPTKTRFVRASILGDYYTAYLSTVSAAAINAANAAAQSVVEAQAAVAGVAASATLAQAWATKLDGQVQSIDFSSKEFAQGSQASTGGSAKNWAQQTGADVTGAAANSKSSKAWAQSVLTGSTLGGSSKDWAQTTGGTVDGTNFSAKELAQGSAAATGGSAKSWASQVGADVTGAAVNSRSARSWSQDSLIGATLGGSAKDWAITTSSTVDGTSYSSKEYAQGAQAGTGGSSKNWAQQTGADVTGAATNSRSAKSWSQDSLLGATLGGSAKDWAIYISGTVDGTNYSAKYNANLAATSATNAGTSATNAATSETNALAAATCLTGTSTTSVLIATGSKVFTTQSGKDFNVGSNVKIVSGANSANYFFGDVTAYSGTTLTVNVTAIGGSGTFADWTIQGRTGLQGVPAAGTGDFVGPASSTVDYIVTFGDGTGKLGKNSGKLIPTGAVVGTTDTQTLTNKTLTSPLGIVKGDVGLGNVDNTSNATERAATATLTNKTLAKTTNTLTGFNAAASDVWTGTASDLYITPAALIAALAPSKNTSVTGSFTPSFAAAFNFEWTLTGNTALNVPTGMREGQSGTIYFIQDATGSRTLSLNSSIKKPGGTAPTLSTAANSVDRCGYVVRNVSSVMQLELTALEKGIA